MRSEPLPQAESWHDRRSLLRLGHSLRKSARSLALYTASFLVSGVIFAAQTNPAQTNPSPAPAATRVHKQVHPHKKPAAATPTPQPPPPPAPIVPPPPNWPANDLPGAATVVFDSRGLLVVASNSSLAQILKEVSLETGVKVEGMDADQRIFGTYGPGPARDVISQLLDGSGYDVLMIGDRGEGTPRQILLTSRSGSAAKSMANNAPARPSNEDTDEDQTAPEPQVEQEPPQPNQNGTVPPVPVRTPQQIMQEIQERQRRLQNAQQNDQQNPQN
jgi:hypothetical protein